MARERPTELPKVSPDQAHRVSQRIVTRQERQKAELDRLKKLAGPGLLAGFFNPQMRTTMRAPKFIRRGYESNIVDDLAAFYRARPRPWRPASCSSCKPTHKERLKIQRRAAARKWEYFSGTPAEAEKVTFHAGGTMGGPI